MDPLFRVNVISCTPNPQQTIYAALHQDYSEGFVYDQMASGNFPDERKAGEIALKRILGGELHAGPLEHAQIVFNVGWFPHSVMQQARTHRIASFDVQCMSGETRVTLTDCSGKRSGEVTMAELYKLWGANPALVKSLNIRSLDEEENIYVTNSIDAVVSSGTKPAYKMTLEDGKSIVCTMEHKILTGKGWKPLGDISTGEYVLVNGRAISTAPTTYQNKEWLESRFKEGKRPKELAVEAGVSTEAIKKWAYHHELSWDKTNWNRGAKYTINISQEERERRRNHAREINKTLPRPKGKNHPSWKEELSLETRAYNWLKYARPSILEKADYKCQNCGSPHNRLHCHHIKPVKTHPELGCEESNIVVLCPACHKQAHSLSAHPVKVISIEAIGEVETYDIAMNAPHHNFVANGVVVHNSMRYTGQRIVQCANGILPVEEVFYLRPEGYYTDRKGHKYHYTEHQRNKDLDICMQGALRYAELINAGYAEEHARGILPFDYRQHFVLSLNMRSLGHLLTIRGKRDAQLEIQQMCQLMLPHFQTWAPEIYSWFEAKQWQKGRLAL